MMALSHFGCKSPKRGKTDDPAALTRTVLMMMTWVVQGRRGGVVVVELALPRLCPVGDVRRL